MEWLGVAVTGATCSCGPCPHSLTRAKYESSSHAGLHTARQLRLAAAHPTGARHTTQRVPGQKSVLRPGLAPRGARAI